MSQEYIEVSEKTLDDAITTACQKLSVTSEKLDYIVVDEGSAGFLGFNSRPAQIKARIKEAKDATEAILNDVLNKVNDKEAALTESIKKEQKVVEEKGTKEVKAAKEFVAKEEAEVKETVEKEVKEVKEKVRSVKSEGTVPSSIQPIPAEKQFSDETATAICDKAKNFLTEVFAAMKMDVQIKVSLDKTLNVLHVDMEGDDMGILIGKRGQTLDSLQYLVSLVVNKGTDGYIHVKADTENYRERRKQTLENLAKNIAFKVKRTKASVALEPMNPYERRIIHSALQNDKYVTTHSEGEEPFRKVVVTIKK